MDVDDPQIKIEANEPSTVPTANTDPIVEEPAPMPIMDIPIKQEIVALEGEMAIGNSTEPSLPPEEVTFENNEFYRLAMADFDDWGASVPRIIASPVTTAHFSQIPPISALSVYNVINEASTMQLALDSSVRISGRPSSSGYTRLETDTAPFLGGTLNRSWHPLPAPPTSLIDSSLPNTLQEWNSMASHSSIPNIRTLIDPSILAQHSPLIQWRSLAPFSKIRRFGKRAVAHAEPILASIKDEKESIDPAPHIRPLPRNAKKRLRELNLYDAQEPELDEERTTKRRKDAKELYIRFPVALALSIVQNTFSTSNKRKGNTYANGYNRTVDSSAAELLASFKSS